MTSWQGNAPLKKLIANDKFYCKTSTSGYCSNFFNFFMSYLFAKMKKKTLYLYDTRNNISKEYHLILDTFQQIPGIEYTPMAGFTLHQIHTKEMMDYFDHLPQEILSKEAKDIFRFSSKTQKEIDTLRKGLPQFDCGVHVRTGDKITTGEMQAIALERYIEEIESYQKTIKKESFTLYLMTDSQDVIQFFKNKNKSWTIITLPSPTAFSKGHDQPTYNTLPTETKRRAFYHFLAEMQILQECPHTICTFSSNIGRFLNLTRKGTIFSLD